MGVMTGRRLRSARPAASPMRPARLPGDEGSRLADECSGAALCLRPRKTCNRPQLAHGRRWRPQGRP